MDAEKQSIIILNLIPEIGPKRFSNLVNRFGRAEEVLKATEYDLSCVEEIGEKLAKKISSAKNSIDADKEIELAGKLGVNIITCFDPQYPKSLKNLPDSPFVLYIKGEVKDDDLLSVAIVGTRLATNYGKSVAMKFSKDFADCGVTTVSGLARGIDTEVHKATIDAGGRTIAVLGNGLNRHYPPENKKLEEKIVKNGALVSEFPLETSPDKCNFPRRNRIISGLSLATLVVEADIKSGALITAKFCLEQGKDVFAVPGPIFSKYSNGTNYLIKSGAVPALSVQEIIEAIAPLAQWLKNKETSKIEAKVPGLELDGIDRQVMAVLDNNSDGVSIDSLLSKIKVSIGELSKALINLELKGFLRSLPGKVFIKNR
jgi:DNA processing protein